MIPPGALPVIGVFSVETDGNAEAIAAALASADDPGQKGFEGCAPAVAWIEPTDEGYRFDWEQGFIDCAEEVPYVAIFELPD